MDHQSTLSLALQFGTAAAVAFTALFSLLNNIMGRKTNAKQDVTIAKVEDVHALANGTTSSLTAALAQEQQKNADLQKMLAAALLGRRSTDNVAAEPPPARP